MSHIAGRGRYARETYPTAGGSASAGATGATGAPGADGAPGAPGNTGPTGPAGASVTAGHGGYYEATGLLSFNTDAVVTFQPLVGADIAERVASDYLTFTASGGVLTVTPAGNGKRLLVLVQSSLYSDIVPTIAYIALALNDDIVGAVAAPGLGGANEDDTLPIGQKGVAMGCQRMMVVATGDTIRVVGASRNSTTFFDPTGFDLGVDALTITVFEV